LSVAIDPEDMEIRGFDEERGISFNVLPPGREQEVRNGRMRRRK
jgi:hypothetical protein